MSFRIGGMLLVNSCTILYTGAEIPPAGAPSGFGGTPQAFALKRHSGYGVSRDILHSLECYLINATMSVLPQCLIILQYLILLQCLISLQCLFHTTMLFQRTYIVPLTQKSPHCVILSGAAQRRDGERESQPLPRSRTPKGRQQAESRHSRKA